MFSGIERLAEGVEFLDAEAIQNLCQNTFGGGNALYQSVSLVRFCIRRAGADGTTQIVDNLQQLAGKVRDRVLPGVLLAPLTLAPCILNLGKRPHQPFTQRRDFRRGIVVFAFTCG